MNKKKSKKPVKGKVEEESHSSSNNNGSDTDEYEDDAPIRRKTRSSSEPPANKIESKKPEKESKNIKKTSNLNKSRRGNDEPSKETKNYPSLSKDKKGKQTSSSTDKNNGKEEKNKVQSKGNKFSQTNKSKGASNEKASKEQDNKKGLNKTSGTKNQAKAAPVNRKEIKVLEKDKKRQTRLDTMMSKNDKDDKVIKEEKKLKAKQETENEKLMNEITKKYPQYVFKGKFKFPIDDKLFGLYPTLLTEQMPKVEKPTAKSGIVPPKLLGDILQIWNFFNSFSDLFKCQDLKKEEIYVSLTYEGEKAMKLLNDMHQGILCIFLQEFFAKARFDTYKDDSEYPFFVLLKFYMGSSYNSDKLALYWTEFAQKLVNLTPYSEGCSETTKNLFDILAENTCANYNQLEYRIKTKVLTTLIDAVYETDVFRDFLHSKMESTSSLIKERTELEQEIRIDEQEYNSIKTKFNRLQKGMKRENAFINNITRLESLRKPREVSSNQIEIQRYNEQLTQLEEVIEKRLERLEKVNSELCLTLQTATNIGVDSQKTEYWVFEDELNKIYLRYSNLVNETEQWQYYNTKSELNQLIKSLNNKAVREKSLLESLQDMIKTGRIVFDDDDDQNFQVKESVDKDENESIKEEEEEETKIIAEQSKPKSVASEVSEEDDYVVKKKEDNIDKNKNDDNHDSDAKMETEEKVEPENDKEKIQEEQAIEEEVNKNEEITGDVKNEDTQDHIEDEESKEIKEKKEKEEAKSKEERLREKQQREREARELKMRQREERRRDEENQFNRDYWFSKVLEYEYSSNEADKKDQTDINAEETSKSNEIQKNNTDISALNLDHIKSMLTDTENRLTIYLEKWEARWTDPAMREETMKRVSESKEISELCQVLLELNELWQYSETLRRKRGRPPRQKEEGEAESIEEERASKESDDDDNDNSDMDDEESVISQREHRHMKLFRPQPLKSLDKEGDGEGEEDIDEENNQLQSDKMDNEENQDVTSIDRENYVDKEGVSAQEQEQDIENKKEEEKLLKTDKNIKKMPIKFWGTFSNRLKKTWVIYTSEVTSITGLYFAVLVLCSTLNEFIEKRTIRYFTLYKTGKEYIAAKKQQKEEAYAKRLEENKASLASLTSTNEYKAPEKVVPVNVHKLNNNNRYSFRPTRNIRESYIQPKSYTKPENLVGRLRSNPRDRTNPYNPYDKYYGEKNRSDDRHRARQNDKLNDLANVRRSSRISESVKKKYDSLNEQQWDTECLACKRIDGEFGNCCMCYGSYHPACVGLESIPDTDWTCETCLQKIASQRQTRGSLRRLQI